MIIAFYGARGRCKLEANISQRFKTFIYCVLFGTLTLKYISISAFLVQHSRTIRIIKKPPHFNFSLSTTFSIENATISVVYRFLLSGVS
jgi:hypothetical protein